VQFCKNLKVVGYVATLSIFGGKIFDHNLVAMQFMLHKKHYDFFA